MISVAINTVVVPGVVALLVALVFTYLYQQSRHAYFRAWQLAWIAYTLQYAVDAWQEFRGPSWLASFLASLLMVMMAMCIVISTRLLRSSFRLRWYDVALGLTGVGLSWWNLRTPVVANMFRPQAQGNFHLRLEMVLAAALLYSSFSFYRVGQRKRSLAFTLLSVSLAFWAALMIFGDFRSPYAEIFGVASNLLGPVPQMLLGIAMVMVLFENERDAVQENALAFSTLGVDSTRLLSPEELAPSMQSILDRLVAPLPTHRAIICFAERWRATLPNVQRGFSPELLAHLQESGVSEYLCELAYRRGGFVAFRHIAEMAEPLPAFSGAGYGKFRELCREQHISNLTAISLQTRAHHFGVILFPHAETRVFGSSNLRLLIGLALQIGLTLENYIVTHAAQRRTKEYALLTQIGQAISSRLDQDEILRAVQKELSQIFDTRNFYVAFQDGDMIRFELEVEDGEILPKRSRKVLDGFTEYIIRTGEPLLVRSDMEKVRERLGIAFVPDQPARCLCGAPILFNGKPAGVMVALSTTHEYVFEPRDLEVLQTAAGQVSVAVENARLFVEEQRRSRQLAFLNNISKTAISSEDFEQMLGDIVGHIQKTFRFDHIGLGILDHSSKDIEIRAEAGTTVQALGLRIPIGVGILGRVARSGETALIQTTGDGKLQGVLANSRAVLCIPIMYSDSLLGVLNVESVEENAFVPEDVLIMKTLADLLATALHNSFVFQKMQQQSITDGLTGIKTRRFFGEAITSEWRRASRSGRPFSVVLIDLDKFKEVNDTMGHLEGDLVLARVGRLLEQKCRQSNVVARYGGDEFIILMPETGVEQAQILAERLRLWLATDPMLAEHGITGSFGVASFPVHGFTSEDVIRVADAGMYVSKHAGGDRVSTAEELPEGDAVAAQRQLVSNYIEGFLQRENAGPEQLEELIVTLKKFSGEDENCNVPLLRESIEALAHAAESREINGPGHGEMVARYCAGMARAMGFSEEEISELTFAARVHDVGKIFVPERILNKAGPLSEEEFHLVRMHPRTGADIVNVLPQSDRLREAVEYHHEAFDGSGYPDGLRGDKIPIWARILYIADAYVNMTTERSFAPAKVRDDALADLDRLSGTKYDGMLTRVLSRELRAERASTLGVSEA